jgi:dTDP-4-amino-4,6-dideoxygalactose transaminase
MAPGRRLWTSPVTFVASSNAGLYCGSEVDFVDIDPETCNISIPKLRQKLEWAQQNNCLPSVLVPVHLAGTSCDMEAIRALALEYNFSVIEDASHCIGGRYNGQPIGSCQFSDFTVFSLHPVKIITTGEGGLILTNNFTDYERLLELRSHGISRNQERMTEPSHGPWYYQQLSLGYNYRLCDIQAALGSSQMLRLDALVSERHALVKRYNEMLKGLPLDLPFEPDTCYSAWHLYIIRLKYPEHIARHRDIFESLRRSGIEVNLHYIPVHLQPYYRQLGFHPGDYPEAERYYQRAITLPLFPGLAEDQQNYVIDCLKRELL